MPRRSAAYHHGHLREAVLAAAASLVDEGEPLGLREIGRDTASKTNRKDTRAAALQSGGDDGQYAR